MSRNKLIAAVLTVVGLALLGVHLWMQSLSELPEEPTQQQLVQRGYYLSWSDHRVQGRPFSFQLSASPEDMKLLVMTGNRDRVQGKHDQWFAWLKKLEPLMQAAQSEPQGQGIMVQYKPPGAGHLPLRSGAPDNRPGATVFLQMGDPLGPKQKALVDFVYQSELGKARL
jgi:hypothetical protein